MLNFANVRKEWFIEQVESLKIKGVPYTEIAAALGVRPQYLNLIKNADRGASEKMTLKLCEAFNINHDDLLERISSYEKQITEIPEINEPKTEISTMKKLPLHDIDPVYKKNNEKPSNNRNEWIDIGNMFPEATSAIRHYGDSMTEYPSGTILIIKLVTDLKLIVWGRNYYVETKEFAVAKRLQNGGEDFIVGYSTSLKTYPDGRLIHEPVKIPKKDILRIHLILGCVTKEFGEGLIPTAIQNE